MPRKKTLRKVIEPPKFSGFKPYGCQNRENAYIELLYEEYEAIKLTDYYFKPHHEACGLMGVSRATFARIYETARRKIANALVESKEIKVSEGNAYFDKNWFLCNKCHARFSEKEEKNQKNCPECSSNDLDIISN